MAIGRDLVEAGDPNRDRCEIVARARGQLDEIGRAKDSGPAVEIINGASIVPRPVAWLWKGWLAQGKFHILAGAAGTGKTTIAIVLAAVVTTGGRWPDGTTAPIGDVLMWSGEDDLADSLVPRLRASGGDPSRIHFIGGMTDGGMRRPFDPSRDIPALIETARRLPSLRMLILDPVVSAVLGDSHKNAETRRALQPLVDFAAEVGCVVLGITHFTKSSVGRDPVERVTGSLAFGTVPRLVMATAKVDTGGKRRLVRAKSNIGPDGGGYEYDLIQEPLAGFDFGAQRVAWGARLEGTARQLLNEVEQAEGSSAEGAQSKAGAFLRETLAGGEMAVAQLKSAAEARGLAWRTVERARQSLGEGIIAFKPDMTAGWHWRLSETELARRPPRSPEGRQQNGLAAFGEDGGLQGLGWEGETRAQLLSTFSPRLIGMGCGSSRLRRAPSKHAPQRRHLRSFWRS
jgi:putative DNA primase/helicase